MGVDMKYQERFNAQWYDDRFTNKDTFTIHRELYGTLYDTFRRQAEGAEAVLDLGCGIGCLLGDWKNPPSLRIGIDWSIVAIERADREHGDQPGLEWYCATFEWMTDNPGDPFDVVMLCEVLEHLDDDVGVWELARSIATQKVVASVPYLNNIRGASHTDRRYDPKMVTDRFNTARVINHPDQDKWIVFTGEPA